MTFAMLCGVVGSLWLAAGIGFIVRGVRRLRRCTGTVRGTVCEILEHRNNDPDSINPPTMKTPVIRYRVDGKKYKHKANFSATSLRFGKGDSVTVRYDPQNPKRVLIKGINRYSSFVYAVVFIFIGLVSFIASRL